MAIVTVNGTEHVAEAGVKLGDLLAQLHMGDRLPMPCGRHGLCGKCKAEAGGRLSGPSEAERRLLSPAEIGQGIRLACCAVVEGDCHVRLLGAGQFRAVGAAGDVPLRSAAGTKGGIPACPAFRSYGIALDIGTTTLEARLYGADGRLLAEGKRLNPQASWGADVISRIEADMRGEGPALMSAVRSAAQGLMEGLACQAGADLREIDGLAVTGNTVMLHLLTGTSAAPLSCAPFVPERLFGEALAAEELGWGGMAPEAEVYLSPCASAFVGGDLITALLAEDFCGTMEEGHSGETRLLADIGTNGEMALWHAGRLLCCSVAAGPAFEGAGISMGMGGETGAIDRVSVQDGGLAVHVIGDVAPAGICGSGAVDALACLLETGRMDGTGYIGEGDAMIADPVVLTQRDVRMVQLAKGAVHAGIRTLLHRAGLACRDVSAFSIAGGFGSFLDVKNAARIGLFPAELLPCVRAAGNAALEGASMLLLDAGLRAVCEGYARRAEVAELSSDLFFAEEYVERMGFYTAR